MKTGEIIEDAVNPQHYKNHPSGVESIEVIENMPFLLGCACKYLFRLGKKDAPIQELKKAEWYLKRWGGLFNAYDDYRSHPEVSVFMTDGQDKYMLWYSQQTDPTPTDNAIHSIIYNMGVIDDRYLHRDALKIVQGLLIAEYERTGGTPQ